MTAAEPIARIFNIMRFSLHDGPGIRTTVFFKGCPLSCWWCHNPESQSFGRDRLYFEERCMHCGDCIERCPEHAIEQTDGVLRTAPLLCRRCGRCVETCQAEARQIAGRTITLTEAISEIEKDLIFFDESGGGVTLTGGEPLSQPQFAGALLDACRERRIHTVLETCGFAQEDAFLDIAGRADLVLFDLKLLDAGKHLRYAGVSNELILRNLEALGRGPHPPVVRIPVVPGVNDSADDIGQFAQYLARIPVQRVDLLPYHRIGREKYRRLGLTYRMEDTPEPAAQDLARFAGGLASAGITVRIGG